ncbi:prolyl 3-hydroxylase 3 isoform X1 [Monodelphis domestica]|uniref:prolyl 3-hydroxylase 3 isoform X1 n=1 Tax=Monodelphis domestica TaxID=13616 RepID=UPI0024E1C7F2|nr:prolyl 3-hydroxylase 3 isoform X1 [Monodelphis domestica]
MLSLLLLLLLLPPQDCAEPPGLAQLPRLAPLQSPDLLYADGLRAYAAGAWERAVALLREALRSRAEVGRARRDCGAWCAAEPGNELPPVPSSDPGSDFSPGTWERLLLRAALRRAECVSQCAVRRLGSRGAAGHRVVRALRDAFRRREPYNYLQRAYYQLKKLDLAVAAAHTFYVANPKHIQIREDMVKYHRMSGVRRQSFRDLENLSHWAAYDEGLELLKRQEVAEALPLLEEALKESLAQMENCRAECEGPEEQLTEEEEEEEIQLESQSGLYEAIAGHWIRVLQCRQRCPGAVATRPGQDSPVPDFLPSQLWRLQEAHAQVGNLSQAMENALSILLFYPEDEAVKEVLDKHQKLLGEQSPDLSAREDIRHFVLQSVGEKKLLYYAMEHLGTSFKDPDPWTPEDLIPEGLRKKLREDLEKRPWDSKPPEPESLAKWRDVHFLEGVTLTQDAGQLNGSERAVLDGLLSRAECEILLQLAKDAAKTGDGYRSRRSPHTPHEHFEGLTVLRAAQLARSGAVGREGAKLLLEASERARTLTQAYFSPEGPLHLSFTHLVCRSAIEGEQEQRMDLSHPVHADNCLLDPYSGECWKEPPAYTHRDYSGLLYLNDDFQGGDLFFTEPDALTVTAQVRPQCGRLVAFSSGGENPHGVWAVTKGRRCTLALWHTRAPEHMEQDRAEAEILLQEQEEPEEGEIPSGDSSPEPPSALGRRPQPTRLEVERQRPAREEL